MGDLLLALLVGGFALVAAAMGGAIRSAYDVRVVRDTVSSPMLPASLDGTSLVFLADVHAGRFFGRRRMAALVDLVLAQTPSLIVLGGDYVGGKTGGAGAFYPEAARLDAPHGVFAVLGNHDAWEEDHDARRALAEAGIVLLENAAARIESAGPGSPALVIAGLADEWTGEPDAAAVRTAVGEDDVGVLIAHNPDSLEAALGEGSPWLVALAGHTHGGQVRGVHALLPHRHRPVHRSRMPLSGWGRFAGTDVLVSNGVGVVTLPLRAFAPAQVHALTLVRGAARGRVAPERTPVRPAP